MDDFFEALHKANVALKVYKLSTIHLDGRKVLVENLLQFFQVYRQPGNTSIPLFWSRGSSEGLTIATVVVFRVDNVVESRKFTLHGSCQSLSCHLQVFDCSGMECSSN